jgi:lipopolysaccharide/colanic/teichoic acid biosynthesis glycosyltransferase
MKRGLDLGCATLGLVASAPILLVSLVVIWAQDSASPLYVAERIGLDGKPFRFIKLRSMVVDASKNHVDTTTAHDPRVTPFGRLVRTYKFDELPQFWHVIMGQMSMVGPRPNVRRETDLYTIAERRLLTVKPGITDFSSIVFADLGEILRDSQDPNLDYNRLVRPWKSRLGLIYVDHASVALDLEIIALTAVSFLSPTLARRGVAAVLSRLGAPPELIAVALRVRDLVPYPPPGSDRIVTSRDRSVESLS